MKNKSYRHAIIIIILTYILLYKYAYMRVCRRSKKEKTFKIQTRCIAIHAVDTKKKKTELEI